MDKISIQNVLKITSLANELEFEKAASLYLQLRVLVKKDKSYDSQRNHLRVLIKEYEKKNWTHEGAITSKQIEESDLAEAIVQAENIIDYKRKKHK